MIQIREGYHEDVATIARFQLAMAKETEKINLNHTVVSQGVKAVMADPGKGKYFVATDEGKVIASLMITFEWSDWRNASVYWIQSVYVTPDYRRQAVYKKMYNHIQKLIEQDPNISGIRLYVDYKNLSAQKVYEKLGMDGTHYQLFEWMKP